jgi:flagellar motor switch protein FliN
MSTAATEALLEELVPSAEPVSETDLARVLDVSVELKVEIGRTTMTIRELLDLAPGTVITLDRMAGEPVDLLVNEKRIARGEVGLRVTEVVASAVAEAAG